MDYVVWGITTLVAAFVGSYLAAYLKKKGENLATHEDIDKLVEQVSAVTAATKKIEAKVSDEVWGRQRRWELRRDILFEIARKAGSERHAITQLYVIYQTEEQNEKQGILPRLEKRVEACEGWDRAASDFEGMLIVVSASCGPDLEKSMHEFGLFMRSLAREILDGNAQAFVNRLDELRVKTEAVTRGIRKELEIT